MTSKTTMILEINELKAKLKAKDEEFIKILDELKFVGDMGRYYVDVEEIKQRIREE